MTGSPSPSIKSTRRDHRRGRFTLRLMLTPLFAALTLASVILSAPPAAATSASSVSADYTHTCALTTSGGVKCWGANNTGMLGDGTTKRRLTPVDVSGLTSGVAAISAGTYHTCALTTSGGVKCWGANYAGMLGDGTKTERDTPVDVSGLTSGVAAISVDSYHTCALTTSGGVKCWGANYHGQLGDGTTKRRLTPVDVSGLTSGVAAISVGPDYTCAVTISGGVKCWGWNNKGQLGDGTGSEQHTPVDVSGLASGVAAISAGTYHACALTTSGGVKCWGANYHGQLGDGTTKKGRAPVDVSGLSSGVAAISAGGFHTCALTTSGGMKCWGANYAGMLGGGGKKDRLKPADVSRLVSGVAEISAGTYHTCAVTISGGVKCWGWNYYGQVGDGTTTYRAKPVDVSGF